MPEIIEYKFELKFGLGNASKADRNCANIGRVCSNSESAQDASHWLFSSDAQDIYAVI